jgi:hypothetical protein
MQGACVDLSRDSLSQRVGLQVIRGALLEDRQESGLLPGDAFGEKLHG